MLRGGQHSHDTDWQHHQHLHSSAVSDSHQHHQHHQHQHEHERHHEPHHLHHELHHPHAGTMLLMDANKYDSCCGGATSGGSELISRHHGGEFRHTGSGSDSETGSHHHQHHQHHHHQADPARLVVTKGSNPCGLNKWQQCTGTGNTGTGSGHSRTGSGGLIGSGSHHHNNGNTSCSGGSFPPLELQQLDGSPRSSHLYLVEASGGNGNTGSSPLYDLSPNAESSLSSQSAFNPLGGLNMMPAGGGGCQLHRGGVVHSGGGVGGSGGLGCGHSETESESSHSSSTDDSALGPGGSGIGGPGGTGGPRFAPYRPSSVLQFERVPISEEEEEDELVVLGSTSGGAGGVHKGGVGGAVATVCLAAQSQLSGGGAPTTTTSSGSFNRTKDDNGNPAAMFTLRQDRAVLRVSGSCSTEGDSSEMEMPSHDEELHVSSHGGHHQGTQGTTTGGAQGANKKSWSITTV